MAMVTARITRMERLTNTRSGNPRWRVHAATPDLSLVWTVPDDSHMNSVLHDGFVGREVNLGTDAPGVITTPAFPTV